MKKIPLYYNKQIVGYIDDIIYNDSIIEIIKLYLFYCESYNEIIQNIKKSLYSKLNIYGNEENQYSFEFIDDFLICKIKK